MFNLIYNEVNKEEVIVEFSLIATKDFYDYESL